jgi:hypothetical protein
MSQKIKTSVEIDGSLKASQIANATTDTDKFLVSDSGTVKYRTGAEVLSDLGITVNTASKLQHQVKAGVAINKGQAVYVTSADGTNMIVGLASNASEATSSKTMGLLNATVAANSFADVITEGLLDGLNTIGANAGDPVWLGTGGNLIYGLANKPSAPNHLVFIGIVTRVNANNGEIFVKVQNGFELNEIHDVDLKTTLPSGNDILAFEGAPVNLWKNKTIASVLGYTPYNASNPAGYISTYTETDTLASVTARGASTSTLSTFDGGLNIGNAKLRWGGTTSPTLGFPFTGGPNAFWIDVNDGDTGGLAIDNDGTTIYGAGDSGHVFRVIDEDVYQATSNIDASTTFRIQQGQNGGGYVRGNFEITGTLSASGYNKTNWDTAYGWGNHASAGYVPQARTITINGTSYDLSANRSWTVTASETDTLATVVARGNTANSSIAVRNSISINKSDGSSGGQLSYDSSINQLYLWNSLSSGYFSVYTNNAERLNISSGGVVTANVDMRSPIFYDSNNTGFYVDPASTTKLNALTLSSLASDDGMIENNTGAYFHLGGWGVGRTAATAVLVNTAYRADYADNAGSASSASSSTRANYLDPNYIGGQQTNPQTYFSNGIGVKVAMTAQAGYWSDTLWINGYTGGDVPWMCALHTQRNSSPRMYISAQYSTSTSYGSLYEFWTNYNMDAPNKSGTSYYQTNTWIQFNGQYGLYWPSNYGCHFAPNDQTSYTQFKILGSKNGYGGILDSQSAVNGMMYDGSGNGGVYREANGRWYWYHHIGNNCTGISTSTTSSSYRAYIGGSLYAEGDIVAYSDRRKKENIITVNNALDKVNRLRGVYYNRIDDDSKKRQVGVIAQEIQNVLPEVVTYAEDVDEYGVSYGNITGLLIEAIKEQQTQIEELKELVNKLINK